MRKIGKPLNKMEQTHPKREIKIVFDIS